MNLEKLQKAQQKMKEADSVELKKSDYPTYFCYNGREHRMQWNKPVEVKTSEGEWITIRPNT
jgi:hypothetical protein